MVKQKSFEWNHVTVLRKHDKGMSVIQCKHCHHVFVGGPFRIRAHLLGLKGLGFNKCRQIDVVIKAEVQKMVSGCANVDMNGESSMECNAEIVAQMLMGMWNQHLSMKCLHHLLVMHQQVKR